MNMKELRETVLASEQFDAEKIEQLIKLAEQESSVAAAHDGSLIERLTAAAKDVRLAGEYPYYTAKAIALWFAVQKDDTLRYIEHDGIEAAVSKICGLEFERELINMIADSFNAFPDFEIDDQRKIELMKEAYRKGYHYEKVYRGCAQCHMAAVSDVSGKEDLVMFRAANGFAAGMGLLGDGVCGGYSGGILSMGMFAGRRKDFFDGDKAEKDLCTKLSGKLHDKYIAAYGSVTCHDIHRDIFGRAFHITRPEEKEAFEEAGAHSRDKCPAVVGTSAAWVAEILYNEGMIK